MVSLELHPLCPTCETDLFVAGNPGGGAYRFTCHFCGRSFNAAGDYA